MSLREHFDSAHDTPQQAIAKAVAAERERCAKIAENMPNRVLVMYARGSGPPGNTYVHISGQRLIAAEIRKSADKNG